MTELLEPIDLIFIETSFYRKFKHFYDQMECFKKLSNISEEIKTGMIYIIKFGPHSPLYLIKIVQLIDTQNPNLDSLRCQVFIRNTQYRKIHPKSIIGETQLLSSSKVLNIPTFMFIALALFTQYNKWEEPIWMDPSSTVLKSCNLLLMNQKDIVFFSNEMSIDDLTFFKVIIGFTKNCFNLNSSLSYVRIPSILNGVTKMEEININIADIDIIIEENIMTPKKQNRKRGRPSFKKEINSDPEKSSTKIKIPSPAQSEESLKTVDELLNLRNLRKRKKSIDPIVHRNLGRKKDFSSLKYKEQSEDEGSTETPNDKIDENNTLTVPRRSSRRQSNALKKEENLLKVPDNDSFYDMSSENNSNGAKKLNITTIFKKKAKEILKRWEDENAFKKEYLDFYQTANNHLPRIPKMGWIEVNVYKLFKSTVQRGGFREVTRKLLWKDVYKALNNTTIVSNAATTIRSHYKKLLYDFENSLFSDTFNSFNPQNNISDENQQIESMDPNFKEPRIADNKVELGQNQSSFKEFLIENILNKKEYNPSPPLYFPPTNHPIMPRFDVRFDDSRMRMNHPPYPFDHGHYPPCRPNHDHYGHRGCNCHHRPPYSYPRIDRHNPQLYQQDFQARHFVRNWEHELPRPYGGFYNYPPPSSNSVQFPHSFPHHNPHYRPLPPPSFLPLPHDHSPYAYNQERYPHIMNHPYQNRFSPYIDHYDPNQFSLPPPQR
ncbi:hypothetical protein MXB_4418 [Myxobolus squamalis]|nr:hypothetical protein MXB_4418 [Myxobolus squamalis]